MLALRPYHAEATWALAGLSEKGGDAETATRVLEHKLEDESLTPPEKARLLTQLAALSRLAGVTPAAERRLLEALGTVPDHVPAIVALADFYADAERWTDLEAFLKEILDGTTLTDAPPALVADLHRRLATAHEKLGRDEEAYQTLVAGDRLHRGHLLIKLAIGENRYKARRWREAALHLSPLAAHEDAARYPSEVAQGLYHAALAEIRSLRPEKAPALYQRALELKPNFAPALQALAEIAMEQGEHTQAADLLTRQATATEDPGERMRLFEALGDMATMILHDDERARACFAAAVAAAQPLEAKHLPLLEKLLERQDQAGDLTGCARTAELMAAFGATPAERAERHLRAAHDYFAAGDKIRARAAAERAVENDPYDVAAVDLASQLAIEQSDVEAAANMLTRLVTAKDDRFCAADAAQRSRAVVPARQGARRARRHRQAIPALRARDRARARLRRRDRCAARPRRAREAERRSRSQERSPAHLGAITAQTGSLVRSRRVGRRAPPPGPASTAARATLELAVACGHTRRGPPVGVPARPQAVRDARRRAVQGDRSRIARSIGGHEEVPLATIATTVAEAAALMWPDLEQAFARAGIPGARRIPATSHASVVSMFPRLTTVLGAGARHALRARRRARRDGHRGRHAA